MGLQAVEVGDMLHALRSSDEYKNGTLAEFLTSINTTYRITKRRWYQYKHLQVLLGSYPWLILYPVPNHLLE